MKIYNDDETSADGEDERDVQKKIMPWRQMMLDEEVVTEVEHGVKQPAGGGLVVVTSLISKVPNLGGNNKLFMFLAVKCKSLILYLILIDKGSFVSRVK